jgi:hypothetical protein
VHSLQRAQVFIRLVGDEDLEAVAVGVGECQLGTRVRLFAAADGAGASRPGAGVETGQLADRGVFARLRLGDFSSGEDLAAKVLAFIDIHNQHHAHPYRWTFTGETLTA